MLLLGCSWGWLAVKFAVITAWATMSEMAYILQRVTKNRAAALHDLLSFAFLCFVYVFFHAAQGTKQQLSLQQLPLLLPSFRATDAWQYSSSNLLRLAQQGTGGTFGSSKPRFKPVAKPEALLRQPKVALRQLRGDVRTALQVGALLCPEMDE
jgi:hypothetical protein